MEGQRILATLVDLAFFVVVGLLGMKRILSEGVLATLLSGYVAHRFGVASGKQQAIVAATLGGGGGGGGMAGGSGGGSGSSQRMPAVRTEIVEPNPRDSRRLMREASDELVHVHGWIG